MNSKFTFLIPLLFATSSTCFAQNTNKAVSFDGATSVITTTATVVPTSGDFTVELWAFVSTTSSTSSLHEFVSQGHSGGGFYIGYDPSTHNIRGGDNWQNTGIPMPLGRWTHIALVQSGGTASLYLDGAFKISTTGYSINTGGSAFQLGNQFAGFSEFMDGSLDQVRVWNVARTASQIKQGLYTPIDPADPSLIANYTANEGAGTVLADSTSPVNNALNGSLSNVTWISSPVNFGTNALTFDASQALLPQVIMPPNAAYDLTTGTVEASVYPTLLDGTYRCIVANRNTGGSRFSFHASSTQIALWNNSVLGTWNYAVPLNTWSHLAWVCDGTNTTLYVNGTLISSIPEAFGTITGQSLNIGVSKTAGADGEAWQGAIDEVRIWNTQRIAGDISANAAVTLQGNESGLVGLFSFDQGNPSDDNSGLLTVIDNTSLNNHGTLFNFALTGATSNFTLNNTLPPTILPVNFTAFTATAKNGQAVLLWQTAQEQNSADFSIERSADGITYAAIGSVPAAGNSSSLRNYSYLDGTPAPGMNYYRLKEMDLDGNSMYSPVRNLSFTTAPLHKLTWYSTGAGAAEIRLSNGTSELYTVTDLSGKTLQQGQLSAGKFILSSLPAGLYIVKIRLADGSSMDTKVLLQ